MAGAGFDAAMIRGADDAQGAPRPRRLRLDAGRGTCRREPSTRRSRSTASTGTRGPRRASCSATSAQLFGGIEVFPDARPDDGSLELGIVTADGPVQWVRTLGRTAVGDPDQSPFVRTTQARSVKVKLDRKVRYELDGGDRSKVKSFKVDVEPGALTVCVPPRAQAARAA